MISLKMFDRAHDGCEKSVSINPPNHRRSEISSEFSAHAFGNATLLDCRRFDSYDFLHRIQHDNKYILVATLCILFDSYHDLTVP